MAGQSNTVMILTEMGTNHDYARSIAMKSDVKVFIVGDARENPCMIRFDTLPCQSDGTIDTTFGKGGLIRTSFGIQDSYGEAMVVSRKGEIIVTGSHNHGSPE